MSSAPTNATDGVLSRHLGGREARGGRDGNDALTAWITGEQNEFVSCDLLRTELFRTVRRGSPDSMTRARTVVDSITILAVASTTFERAGELTPPTLPSLYAIHLAAALDLGDDLDGLVTYDEQLAAAAASYGINMIAPGR